MTNTSTSTNTILASVVSRYSATNAAMMTPSHTSHDARAGAHKPRVGFLGLGWIGLNRLRAMAAAEVVEIAALADLNFELAQATLQEFPGAVAAASFDDLLQLDLDGLVIATPNALHAQQTSAALEAGLAVFCQKPLGTDLAETAGVIETARRHNRLLDVDMSYRHLRGVAKIKELISARTIGEIFAAELIFHNAYGPDKPWYYNPALAGGGCVTDLGVHMIDLGLWMLDFPEVSGVSSSLFAGGRRLRAGQRLLEDFAAVDIELASGAALHLSCSWRLAAGRDAEIRAAFYGTEGALMLRNVNGSFYDFCARHCIGTSSTMLDNPPDGWGGRAAVAWARRLCEGARYRAEVENALQIARVIDAIYGRPLDG
jgi:predicted dehydrogenase